MVYRVIGVMSGSSLDGLDIVFVELDDNGGRWAFDIKATDCYEYEETWRQKLQNAKGMTAYNYLLLDVGYGRYIGEKINEFIDKHSLHHQVQLIASHGHTVFHTPEKNMTAQLGDGAAIAAVTGVNAVTNLRAMDVALNGQGAPIVPLGEKLLWADIGCFLNIGGIANVSVKKDDAFIAFDVCPANRVLNMLAGLTGSPFDKNGEMARSGQADIDLLIKLNGLEYYRRPWPKSLANEFGTDEIFPLIQSFNITLEDALATYTEHIAEQVCGAFYDLEVKNTKLMITGGGAFNTFLIERLKAMLQPLEIEVIIPADDIVKFKEALVMALIGVLRWREEKTVLSSVTGAKRSSIGGAVWIGQEA